MFHAAHLLYRIWGSRGLKDYAVFPIEVCPYDPNTCSAKEFARRFKDKEAFWINTLKTLETRGFNVRNERPVKRRVNFFRHQQQKAQRRATMAQQPHSDGLSGTPSTSAPPVAMHGSIAMPGALRNSSYARTAHTLLAEIQKLGQPPPAVLPIDHPLVQYLSPMNNKTLNEIIYAMQHFSLEQLNILRPLCPPGVEPRTLAGPAWSTDLTLLVIRTVTAHVECVHRHNESHVSSRHRKLLVVKFLHPGLDEVGGVVRDPLIVASIPLQYREKVGTPLMAFKYEKPIGMQWHDTRQYAHMTDTDIFLVYLDFDIVITTPRPSITIPLDNVDKCRPHDSLTAQTLRRYSLRVIACTH